LTIILKKRYGFFVALNPITLTNAPLGRKLQVLSLDHADQRIRLILLQMGLGEGEFLEKVHVAPLQDPFSIRIGNQLFTLRREVGDHVMVGVLP